MTDIKRAAWLVTDHYGRARSLLFHDCDAEFFRMSNIHCSALMKIQPVLDAVSDICNTTSEFNREKLLCDLLGQLEKAAQP